MNGDFINVALGGITLRVPLVIDEPTTRRVAKEVSDHLERLLKGSEGRRFDTYDFALLTAMAFASELERERRRAAEEAAQLRAEKSADEQEYLSAIKRIGDALRDALRDARDD